MLTFFILTLTGFAAWFVSTLGGGGGAIIFLPVVGFLFGAQATAPLVTLTTFVANPARIYMFREHIAWEVMRWYLPAAIAGSLLGAWTFANTSADWLQILIGLFLISTVFQYRFGKTQKTFTMRLWMFMPVGFCVTYLSGLIGASGPLLNPFYLNYGLVKKKMVATKSANAFAMHVTKIAAYTAFGAIRPEYLVYGVSAGIAAAAGSWVAKKSFRRIDEERFRQIVLVIMAVSGVVMIWRQRHFLLP